MWYVVPMVLPVKRVSFLRLHPVNRARVQQSIKKRFILFNPFMLGLEFVIKGTEFKELNDLYWTLSD